MALDKTGNHHFIWSLASKHLIYLISLDPNFATFLLEDTTWLKKTNAPPLCGLENVDDDVPQVKRRKAAQKVTHLQLMLG